MNKLFKYRASKVLMLLIMFMASTVGASLFFAKSASADWFDDLSVDYIVYKKPDSSPTSFLYYSGKDSSWKFLQAPNIPKVHLDGKSCDTADANIDFDSSKVYNNCTGLIITPNTQPDWFKEANLVFKIGDYDSDENIEVTGGRVTKVGSKTDANITSGGKKSQAKAHDGCSGGNPNKTDSCSALLVFNYSYGESFKITIDNNWNGGSSGHEYYYDAPAMENYRTLTFDPNGGTIPASQLDRHYTVTLWEHPGSGSNLLREYKKSAKVGYYPVPQRVGYTFNGWYDGSTNRYNGGDSEANGRFNLTSDTTLVANWTASSYTITYNSNGGTGTMTGNPFTQNSGTAHSVKANTFTRTGYEFVKWCTAANGTGTCYAPGNTFTVTGSVTLYAQWDTWTITAYTYSAVNPANPMDSDLSNTTSSNKFNTSRKSAYPSHPTFGGHAARSEDQVYYMVRVIRSSDTAPSAATFKYMPNWVFGLSLIANENADNGATTPNISALCTNGFSYNSSARHCTKANGSWVDASLASGASGYYAATTALRSWNNSGVSLNSLKGMDLCQTTSFNRQALTSAGGNDTTAEYWGTREVSSVENRCSVTVRTPWILQPLVTNSLGIGTSNVAVGDSYTITPSVDSSQTTVEGTSHSVSVVQVIGSGSWNPVQGISANLNVAPTAANIASFGSGAASIATLSTVSGLTDANFASGTWNGTALSQTFQDAWYGKKVCYYTVVSNAGGWAYDKTTEYRYSDPVCVKWSKSPQVQLRGADASSGGIWDGTSTAYNGGFLGVSQSDARRGSWSQYGLLGYKGTSATTGNVSFFGSGGWTANYSASNRVNACAVTFANVIGSTTCSTSATGGGLYNGSSLTQTISLPTNAKLTTAAVNALPLAGATPITDAMVDGLASGTYRVNADTHITALTLTSSRQITLVSAGNIYLDGNITTASSTFSDLNQVPILNIIAGGQIIVGTGVTQLFGTYINASASATSGFITCPVSSSSTDMRDGGACNSQLRVNGAVISRTTPALRRTIGSGYSSSSTTTVTTNGETHLESITASELFNYQPNLFLTPYAIRQSSTTGNTWIVTKQTVLPARF